MICPNCNHHFGRKKYRPFGVPEIECHKCSSILHTGDKLLSLSGPLEQKFKFFIYAMNYSKKEFVGDKKYSNVVRNWLFLLILLSMFLGGLFSNEFESLMWRVFYLIFVLGLAAFAFQEFPKIIREQKVRIKRIEEAYKSSVEDNEPISSLIYFQ